MLNGKKKRQRFRTVGECGYVVYFWKASAVERSGVFYLTFRSNAAMSHSWMRLQAERQNGNADKENRRASNYLQRKSKMPAA